MCSVVEILRWSLQQSSSLLVAKPSPSATPPKNPDFEKSIAGLPRDALAPAAYKRVILVSAATQTEDDLCMGPCHLFLSVVTQCTASTQVSHHPGTIADQDMGEPSSAGKATFIGI
ncbi:hypothetical protein MTO96_024552 [Rhipicephalus appendiculatus]